MATVFLIEFNTWHGECLEPQIEYLVASGHSVELLCTSRNLASVSQTALNDVRHTELPSKKGIKNILVVWRKIWSARPDFVILNTAQGSEALKLSVLPMPKGVKFIGTIHNLQKLTKSLGQKIIDRRMSGYYVIANYLLSSLRGKTTKPCQYYSPLSKTATGPTDENIIKAKGTDIWLCIPGAIEYKRRNYDALLGLAAAQELKKAKFVLLCNKNKGDGPDFMRKVEERNLSDRFITFSGYVEPDVFDQYIRASDYLLPLIDGAMAGGEAYKTSKASGTFTLSAAYGKTMLCDNFLKGIEDFDYPCLFYSDVADLARIVRSGEKANFAGFDFEAERRRYDGLLARVGGK